MKNYDFFKFCQNDGKKITSKDNIKIRYFLEITISFSFGWQKNWEGELEGEKQRNKIY